MIKKSDIKTYEELIYKYKEKLNKEDLNNVKVQEFLMFAENSLQNLKSSYKEQNETINLKNNKLYATLKS